MTPAVDVTPAAVSPPTPRHRGSGGWLAHLQRRLPPLLGSARFAIGGRAALGVCLVALLAVGVAVGFVVLSRPTAATLASVEPSSSRYTARGYASESPAAAPTTAVPIVVDVEGKVRAPGVHPLPAGSRLTDALAAAGGALPGVDLSSLDLASRVVDGEQIRVGLPVSSGVGGSGVSGTAGSGAATSGSSVSGSGSVGSGAGLAGTGVTGAGAQGVSGAPSADNPLDLNAASAQDLDALPGIGPALAARIVSWRDAHGPFSSVSGLGQVPGIGPSKLATLTPLVRV